MSNHTCTDASTVDGKYKVNYGTNAQNPEGCGIITLANGILAGSDASYDWQGTYYLLGNRLLAKVEAIRIRAGVSIFGDTGLIELELIGEILNEEIHVSGTRANDPEQKLFAVLTRI